MQRSRLSSSLIKQLDSVPNDDPNDGVDPLDSDVEEEKSDDEYHTQRKMKSVDELEFSSFAAYDSNTHGDTDDADDLTSGGIKWKPNQYIPQPTNVSIGKKSTLKDEYRGKFRTELSSFLAFFPIEFWQLYLEQTNVYGSHLYNTAKQTAEQRVQYMVVGSGLTQH